MSQENKKISEQLDGAQKKDVSIIRMMREEVNKEATAGMQRAAHRLPTITQEPNTFIANTSAATLFAGSIALYY